MTSPANIFIATIEDIFITGNMKLKYIIMLTASVPLLFLLSCAGGDKTDEAGKLNYNNARYSFAVTFPESWRNYVVFEKADIIAPGYSVDSLYFAMPARSRNWQPFNVPDNFAEIFIIRIFKLPLWEGYYNTYRDNPLFYDKNDKVIYRSEEYVYLLRYSTALPADLYSFTRDIDSIAATFRYTGKK
jgi:hypothetical protein